MLGEATPIAAVTTGHANAFRAKMLSDYSPAYTCKMVKLARQMFRDAVDRRLIDANPFAGVRAGNQINRDRLVYVPVGVARQLIDETPDVELKLTIALARFAGLRIPSEIDGLRWGDVSWDTGRMTIRCPKMKSRGKGTRIVPIFPEIRPLLQAAFDAAEVGEDHGVTRYRRRENVRGMLTKLMGRAAVTPWVKPWQNLRASCATDLCNFPGHVAAAWLGHTERVADLQYRQVTDDHLTLAIAGTEDAQRQAQQYAPEPTRTDSQADSESSEFSEECGPVPGRANDSKGQSGIRTRDNRFCKPTP